MRSVAVHFNPIPLVAAGTRRLQALQPGQSLKGLTRFAHWMNRHFPPYQGVIRLPDGLRLEVDSRQSAERWLLFAGDYQPAITRLLREHTAPGAYCVDAGANLGFFTLKLARWAGPSGRVLACEANPVLAERIRRHAALNQFDQIQVIEEPVHCEAGLITFYISPDPGKSSVHAGHVTRPVETLTLQATTLDAAIRQQGWTRLDVIKLDIEGNDCAALLGARETLTRFRPFILFEYWYNTPPEIAEPAFALLDSLGYRFQALHANGHPQPFDWRAPSFGPAARHTDVIASIH